MINEKRLLNEFIELVKIDSLSSKEGKIAKVLKTKLEELGLEVYEDHAGKKVSGESGNLIAKLKGNKKGDTILFSSHMDTVKPGEGIEPIVENGIISSKGNTILGADDKAGIAGILEGIRVLKESNIEHNDIEVVFCIWEEGGLFGSKYLEYDKLESKYGFILDSTGSPGEIVNQGPTQDSIKVEIIGRPAHAGLEPENGVSAIMVAAQAISKMNLLRIDEDTTANIGIVKGGDATNVVMPNIIIEGEARSSSEDKLTNQTEHMVKVFKDTANDMGAEIKIETNREYPPFYIEESSPIIDKLKSAFNNMGIKPHLNKTGGGSDTNIFNGKGIESINLGIGMKKPHTTEEYITVEDLNNTARMVVEIAKSF